MNNSSGNIYEGFRQVSPYDLCGFDPFNKIGKQWMLIASENEEGRVNAMTASWGTAGVLWNKAVAVCFIRPQRYTFELTEKEDTFTLCFLGEEHRDALMLCGRESGRDMDKLGKAGLSSIRLSDTPAIAQSETVLVCKKLYCDYLKEECFLDPAIYEKNYPGKDYHRIYVCEIIAAYVKE